MQLNLSNITLLVNACSLLSLKHVHANTVIYTGNRWPDAQYSTRKRLQISNKQ